MIVWRLDVDGDVEYLVMTNRAYALVEAVAAYLYGRSMLVYDL